MDGRHLIARHEDGHASLFCDERSNDNWVCL